jgi:aminoglycoside 6'-N-acetyltransferase I
LWDKVKNIQNFKGHPYEFYQKMGYVITGVVPDANGRGKPDIMMSKRVAS